MMMTGRMWAGVLLEGLDSHTPACPLSFVFVALNIFQLVGASRAAAFSLPCCERTWNERCAEIRGTIVHVCVITMTPEFFRRMHVHVPRRRNPVYMSPFGNGQAGDELILHRNPGFHELLKVRRVIVSIY